MRSMLSIFCCLAILATGCKTNSSRFSGREQTNNTETPKADAKAPFVFLSAKDKRTVPVGTSIEIPIMAAINGKEVNLNQDSNSQIEIDAPLIIGLNRKQTNLIVEGLRVGEALVTVSYLKNEITISVEVVDGKKEANNEDEKVDQDQGDGSDNKIALTMQPSQLKLRMGELARLKAFLGTEEVTAKGSWQAADSSRVSVDQTGLVTAIQFDSSITFTYADKKATVPVEVEHKPIFRYLTTNITSDATKSALGKRTIILRLEHLRTTDKVEITPEFSVDWRNLKHNNNDPENLIFELENSQFKEIKFDFDNVFVYGANNEPLRVLYQDQKINFKITYNPDLPPFVDSFLFNHEIIPTDSFSPGPDKTYGGKDGFSKR